MEKSDNLKLITLLLTGVFLLVAIRTSYLDYAENTATASSGDWFVCVLNGLGLFMVFEIPYILITYVVAPMIADAMPGIWRAGVRINLFVKSLGAGAIKLSRDIRNRIRQGVLNRNREMLSKKKSISRRETGQIKNLITDEIRNYTFKTFENILNSEQIEKFLDNLRKLNKGGEIEVVAKEPLPDYIFQFDILHFVWNVCKRVYDKQHSRFKLRDRAAEIAKYSFPLIVTSSLESISRTMTNDDNRTFSLPRIEVGKPLLPHDFTKAKGKNKTTE